MRKLRDIIQDIRLALFPPRNVDDPDDPTDDPVTVHFGDPQPHRRDITAPWPPADEILPRGLAPYPGSIPTIGPRNVQWHSTTDDDHDTTRGAS